jgi:hypothetical protein
MATSEIDKLERRYAENPHGLTFAPLAEIHRKNGDIPRALELLRIGLELHPNYIPASIVLGRCHQDLGDLPAAEEAFSHVLRLDDENVIALKSLADINERQQKLDDAEGWLRRLVSVDRSNEEARQQLQHLETLRGEIRRSAVSREVPVAPVEVPQELPLAPTAPAEPVAPVEAQAEVEAPVPESAPAGFESLDLTEDTASEESRAEQDSSETQPESLLEPVAETPAALDVEIELEEDVVLRSSGASEFTVPDASQDFMALAAQLNVSRPRNSGRQDLDGVAAEPRAPVQENPPPVQEPPPPAEVELPIAAEAEPPPPSGRSYAARDTQGQSLAAFFRTLLQARPPAGPGTSGSTSSGPGPTTPGSAQDGHGTTRDAAVSFDEFFGSGATGASSRAGETEPGKDDLDQFHSWLQNLKR